MLARLRQIAASPLWLASLATNAKSFESNPIIASQWLNQQGRLHVRRVALAHRIAAFRRRSLERLVAPDDRDCYERDGIVVLRNFLPAATFAELIRQLRNYRGKFREMAEGDTINRKIALDGATLAAVPALLALTESARWQGLFRYVGSRDSEPWVFLESLFRHACDGPDDPQTRLHADTFHPTVKSWFFLNRVEPDAGPFTYVPGSHRLTPERLAWEARMSQTAARSPDRDTRQGSFRISREELKQLGLPPPRTYAVPANTLIVADTFGFHARGPSSASSQRIEVFAFGRRSPFPPWAGLDPWTAAGLAHRIKLLWRYRDLLEAAGLKKNFMRRRDGVTLFDPV